MTSQVEVREFVGSAEELHALPMPTDGEQAQLWIMRPTAPVVVMGSSQRPEMFDLAALARDGIELAARRSGGGAVFIDPAVTVWVDVLAPRSSELWSSELTENFLLVGRRWQQALGVLGHATNLCETSSPRTAASSLACWAGIGWGELTVGPAKVLGLSQRRTRWGSRVQAMAVLDASSARVQHYFRDEFRPDLTNAVATTTVDAIPQDLETEVLNQLM